MLSSLLFNIIGEVLANAIKQGGEKHPNGKKEVELSFFLRVKNLMKAKKPQNVELLGNFTSYAR